MSSRMYPGRTESFTVLQKSATVFDDRGVPQSAAWIEPLTFAGHLETMRFGKVTYFKTLNIEASHEITAAWHPLFVGDADDLIIRLNDNRIGPKYFTVQHVADTDMLSREVKIAVKEDPSLADKIAEEVD